MERRDVAVVAFYDSDKNVLLQDRKTINKRGERWGFFGGGMEKGETPEQAIIREIKEELDYHLEDFDYLKQLSVKYPDIFLVGHVFVAPLKVNLEDFNLQEGDGMKLFSMKEARNLNIAKGDHMVLDELEKHFEGI